MALSRAITLVESSHDNHLQEAQQIIEQCLNLNHKTVRIGITGVPGVGKSTFIETLGTHLTASGKKVAVLAVDPSSSTSRGSILGDKTRMQELAKDKNAFIRPSPSNQTLGGVTRTTRETMLLCEAAGFNVILVETVGVGQSETMVHSMVDFFLLLKLAGAGDELQGMKRGIIEMADAVVINKSDGDNIRSANVAQLDFQRALQLFPAKKNGWNPEVLTCSATENIGVGQVWELVEKYVELTTPTGFFSKNRQEQYKNWLLQYIENRITSDFYKNQEVASKLPLVLEEISTGKISPFRAAEDLLFHYRADRS